MLDFTIQGKGKLKLDPSDFLAEGGEGKIFAHGDTVFKIYSDPSKMIPYEKIQELSAITLPNIIKPEDIILDKKNRPIGYSMKYVTNTYVLCQLFTRAFKNKNNVNQDQILFLVKRLQEGIEHLHKKEILVVDCNELNFLVRKDLKEVYFIDTNTYQTKKHPATAIMPNIKDPLIKDNKFTVLSDWYSWGIITFQLFTGIHPFKGRHDKYKGFEERMAHNISVFNKDVLVPAACDPVDVIPDEYRKWYFAIFEEGKRLLPPQSNKIDTVIYVPRVNQFIGSNKFIVKKIEEFSGMGELTNIIFSFGHRFVTDKKSGKFNNNSPVAISSNSEVIFTPQLNKPIVAYLENGLAKFTDFIANKEIGSVSASDMMVCQGRVYIKNGTWINEIRYIELPNTIKIINQPIANVSEKATTLFDGIAIQNLIDMKFVSVFPSERMHKRITIPEIAKHKIIDAKYESSVLMMIGVTKQGRYDRFVLRFNSSHDTYDMRIDEDIVYSGLNFTVLKNGICIHIDEKDDVNVFKNTKDDTRLTVVSDNAVNGKMKIHRYGDEAVITKNNSLYTFKMK